MKQKLPGYLLLTILLICGSLSTLYSQGTAFTYQGRFTDGGVPSNGSVEFQCTLWDALSGGAQVAAATPSSTVVGVTNGLFTLSLDFGTAAFDGSDRYLQIEARTALGPFTLLTPRQKVSPAPYAMLAGKLTGTVTSNGLAGTYGSAVTFSNTANVFSGTFSGNGGGLTNLNVASLGGLSASNFWQLGGNAGTIAGTNFLGTTDNQPLELKANRQRILRLEPISTLTNVLPGATIIYSNAPNLIGGSPVNTVDAGSVGSIIGGGGLGGLYADQGAGYTFFGAFPNRVSGKFETIAGGLGNTILADYSVIGGGTQNFIQTNATYATISGGSQNTNSGYSSIIGGGFENQIQTNAAYSTIGGGQLNSIQTNATWATISGGNDNIISSNASGATISGGEQNTINANAQASVVGGGFGNTIGANTQQGTVPGGFQNTAAGDYSFAAGNSAQALHKGSFVWADSSVGAFASGAADQFLIRARGGVGIGTSVTPNGSLNLSSGGLAVTGASSPYYGTAPGVFIEGGGTIGNIFAFTYATFSSLPLVLNSPGGNVGIGRTPTANALEVNGNASKAVAGSWLANSDARIKNDIEPVVNALSTLEKVHLVSFRYNDDYRATHHGVEDRRYLNVVAQQFRDVFPDDVKSSGEKLPNGEEILQVDTYPLTIYSAAAIQELNHKLEKDLKSKELEIDSLKQRLEKLEKAFAQKTASP